MPPAIPVFLVVTAVIAWLNARFLRLPSTIGVMAAALMLSALAVLLHLAGVTQPAHYAQQPVFSVLVQGLSIEKLVRRLVPCTRRTR